MANYNNLLSEGKYDSTDLTAKVNAAFVDLYKRIPVLRNADSFKRTMDELTAKLVKPNQFAETPPLMDEIVKILESKAEAEFSEPWPNRTVIEDNLYAKAKELFPSVLDFLKRKKYVQSNVESIYQEKLNDWKKTKKEFITAYVSEKREAYFLSALNTWSDAKKSFEEAEAARVDLVNESIQSEIKEAQRNLDNFMHCDEAFLHESIQKIIPSLDMNFTACITYMLDLENGLVALDVSLPEITDLPSKKVVTLPSGNQSVQEKLVSEKYRDHARCSAGLAFYLAAHIFNISLSINKVYISGYTPMISPFTGNKEDTYLLEVLFDRNKFATLNIPNCHPEDAISLFKNQFELSVRNGLKPIKNGDAFKIALMNREEVVSGNLEVIGVPIDVNAVGSDYPSAPSAVDMKRLDPMFADVARYIVMKQEGSTSRLQRAFEVGYNRMGKIMDQMEAAGIVGPNMGPKGRDVLIQDLNQLELLLKELGNEHIYRGI